MNKIILKLYSVVFLFSLVTLRLNAQVLPEIQKALVNHQNNNILQEKLFVQTDNEFYLTGEILWFKAYYTDLQNKPLNVSKVAYVEVLDEANTPVLQAKISLKNGSGNGSLYIPVNLNNGTYKLRAYTNWMKNLGADVFFEKPLKIINTLNTPQNSKAESKKYNLQFFPEGGDLVEGITSKVGFKILGSDGKGMDISGVIVNNRNDTLARFKTLKFGIGQFSFMPLANNDYKAIARSAQGEIIIQQLPAAKKTGYVLNLKDENANLNIDVFSNLGNQKLYLVAHNGIKTVFASTGEVSGGKASFVVKKDSLADGITYLTAFNNEGKAVAERLYFKKSAKKLTINAVSDSKLYNNRQEVNVNLLLNDEKNLSKLADVSISVHKVDSLDVKNYPDIESYLWLSSNLKGEVESPGYYFEQNNLGTSEALDNLLLTQGWRRFNWADVLSGKKAPVFKFLPEYNGHIVSGKIVDKAGNAINNHLVYMSVPGKRIQFYGSTSDSTGQVVFNTKDFYGQNEVVLQTNTELDSTSLISINNPFFEKYSANKYLSGNLKTSQLNDLSMRNLSMQVQNVYSGTKLKQFYKPDIDSSAFYLNPYKTYKLSDYTRFTTMEEVLREYVAQVFVYKKQKRFHFHILGEEAILDEEVDPLVLLDGVPYFNMDKVIAIDPLKVEKLEVIRSRYYYGPTSSEGILSFSTMKSDLGGTEIDPRAVVIDYEGMQLQREFYSPTGDDLKNKRIPDFRSTLYWSPEVNIDANGKGKVSFYTSDKKGSYIGVVQGLTASGIPGVSYFSFEVK